MSRKVTTLMALIAGLIMIAVFFGSQSSPPKCGNQTMQAGEVCEYDRGLRTTTYKEEAARQHSSGYLYLAAAVGLLSYTAWSTVKLVRERRASAAPSTTPSA